MKTIVVYKSKTGFAKKYAEWIAKELKADLFEHSMASAELLEKYDAIVFGGGLYAGGINGISLIKKGLERLKGKKVAVFATGASPMREDVVNDVKKKNFSAEQLKQLKFFYLRGGFNYNKLGFVDRQLMKLMKKNLSNKKNPAEDETGMLKAIGNPVDFSKKENIKELVEFVKKK